MKRRVFLSIIGITLSIFFLFLSFKGLNFEILFSLLKDIDLRLFCLSFLFILSASLVASTKWSFIHEKAHIKDTFPSLLIGLFFNNILPVRLGEVARGYILSKKTQLPLTYGLSTVLLDRLFDFVGLFSLALIFFPGIAIPLYISNLIKSFAFLLFFFLFLFFFMGRKKMEKILERSAKERKSGFLSELLKRIKEIQKNIARLNSFTFLSLLFCLGMLQWFLMSLAFYFTILSIGIAISFSYVPFIYGLLNMGLIIPSSPGAIGTYEFITISLLSLFKIPKTEAFAVAILFHFSWYLLYTLLGLFFFLREQIKLKEIASFP